MVRRARARMMELVGIQELIEVFETMEQKSVEIVSKASEEVSEFVEKELENKVKVKSGKLKNSISRAKVKSKRNTSAFWKVYTKGVRAGGIRYGFHVETGTIHGKSQKYARPGVDKNLNEIEMIFERKILELLNNEFAGGVEL